MTAYHRARRSNSVGLAIAASMWMSCGPSSTEPLPQWLVVISTNASVPQFGDTVFVEVLDSSGAAVSTQSRRQLSAGQAERWPLSFGIEAHGQQGVRVRARLYRSDHTGSDGLAPRSSTIDALGTLPPQGKGIRTVSLYLSMDCFDVPSDVAARTTCDPATGQSASEPVLKDARDVGVPAHPGSWEPGLPGACETDVPEGMVCVPGGVFLLGSPLGFPVPIEAVPMPERLVRVSAFALDREELTVGQMRALVREQGIEPPRLQGGTQDHRWCTWVGVDDPSSDAMPVNCIRRDQADGACALLGKRLPTEAEWEWAAGNGTLETTYPWGFEGQERAADVCARAVVARTDSLGGQGAAYECRYANGMALPPGPQAGGVAGDVNTLGIRNLSGNVAEWTADDFAPYEDDCWKAATKLLTDPRCTAGASALGRSYRGGSWASRAYAARVFERSAQVQGAWTSDIGFRCVKGTKR